MPRPLQVLAWKDFLGMFDGVASEAQQGQGKTVQNLYRSPTGLIRRGGFTPLHTALSPNQSHDGLLHYKIGSTEYLIAAHDGKLVDWLAGTPGTTVTNSTGKLTSGTDANGAWIDSMVYWGDGVKQNIRHDGTDAVQVLTDTPSSAPSLANGGGTGPTGTFSYYVTFVSDDGHHSPVSPLSGSITVVNDQIDLSAIPTCGAGQDCSGRGIWRNKDGTTAYYLVTIVAGNVVTTYSDTTVDDDLGQALTDVLGQNLQNRRFPPTRYLVAHQNRLVGAFCTAAEGDKQTVYVSNFREPWYYAPVPDLDDPTQGTAFPLQGPGAGEVTGVCSHGTTVAVFTADAAWTLTSSDQLLDYTLHRFSNHGCVAHRTIKSVRDMLIWASSDGVYMAREGQGVTRISDDVKVTYQAISTTDLAKAHSFVWDDKYFFCWPSGSLVFDLRYGVWTRNTNFTWRVATVTALGRAIEKVYGAIYGSARVYQLETTATDNETPIDAIWESHDFNCSLPYREKRLHRVSCRWRTATGDATLELFRGTGTTAADTATQDLSDVAQTGAQITVLDHHCAEQLRDEWLRIKVSYSGTATTYELGEVACLFQVVT